jgi:hypothetical protein
MRLLCVLLTFAVIATAQSVRDPAKLEVTASGGSLSYKVINQLPYRIVGFEIYTQFTSGGFEHLGCVVSADVKSAKDLSLTGVCQLPIDAKTGEPVTYSSHIVCVNFGDGLTWAPPSGNGLTCASSSKESQSEKR